MYCQSYGTSGHITLLCCAAGMPHPPMIIYAKSFPGGQYRFEGTDDAVYARSESGWIDSELFVVWLFHKYAVSKQPILLLTDGTSLISILMSLTFAVIMMSSSFVDLHTLPMHCSLWM